MVLDRCPGLQIPDDVLQDLYLFDLAYDERPGGLHCNLSLQDRLSLPVETIQAFKIIESEIYLLAREMKKKEEEGNDALSGQ